jgi:D-alanyl-D-alanine carboxypeptidase/D-alanyl-D-alanine-endopeptidase (penicillin-binding protein 4)
MNRTPCARCLKFLLLLVFIFQISASVPSFAADQPADSSPAKVIEAALADPVLAHGIQGVLIESLKDGRVLYEKNGDLALVPASNFKLLVSATALDFLGPDQCIRTSLYTSGDRKPDSHLKGDVILVGEGDPVFKYDQLQALVAKFKKLGVKVVEGNVVGDDTWFDDIRLGWGWAWDDEPYYYSAQISALNLNENVVDVWVRPGKKVGDPALVKVTPPTSYMIVRNECTTGEAGSEKDLLVDRIRGRNTIRVTGKVPLDYKPESAEEAITMDEPTLYTCQTLIEMLRREGITVNGQAVRGKKPDGAELVAVNTSPPVSELLAMMNKPSDNMIAECLLKTLGAQFKGKGSTAAGGEVELEFLKKVGADPSAVGIMDGSGLSRMDLISPRNMVALLKYMYRHKYAKFYMDSLPVAGVDGTLQNRMKDTAAQGNVKAKTGYVSRVSTVSGYVTTKAGEPLVFSIMMNNHLCRNKEATAVQDKILEVLVNIEH